MLREKIILPWSVDLIPLAHLAILLPYKTLEDSDDKEKTE